MSIWKVEVDAWVEVGCGEKEEVMIRPENALDQNPG